MFRGISQRSFLGPTVPQPPILFPFLVLGLESLVTHGVEPLRPHQPSVHRSVEIGVVTIAARSGHETL